MSDLSSWSFSLNREDVLRRKAERDQIADQIAALQQKLEAEDRWFEAVSFILPPALKASLASILPAAEGGETRSVWRRGIEPVVSAATRGMLPKEIAQGIREGEDEVVKERLARNPNGIYAALERMVDDGQVVKHGDKFYSAALYDALSNSGELDEDADDSGFTGVNGFIISLILTYGPLPPKEIIKALKEAKDYGPKVLKNPQYGYSAIARLVRQGHLIKDGAVYTLQSKKNELADVSPSSSSDAGTQGDVFL